MPELPEVETLVRELRPQLVRRRLVNVRLHHQHVLREVSARRLRTTLEGNRVRRVERRAKHVVIQLATGERLVIQPRMTGTLLIYHGALKPDERKYAVFEAGVGRNRRFVFRDVRRLGTIHLLNQAAWVTYTARIGPEPLEPSFGPAGFFSCMRGTRQAIKKALMDQKRIAGIGNIYANEALFRARIDPSRRTDRLDRNVLTQLFREVRAVLQEAIDASGTTIRDYRTSTGAEGGYQRALQVYGRGGQPCPQCSTTLTTTHAIDGRSTTFCWRCQGVRPT